MNTSEQNINRSIVPPEITKTEEYYKWLKEMVESGRASKGFIYAMSTLDLQGKWSPKMNLSDFEKMLGEHCTDMNQDEKDAVMERAKIILQ